MLDEPNADTWGGLIRKKREYEWREARAPLFIDRLMYGRPNASRCATRGDPRPLVDQTPIATEDVDENACAPHSVGREPMRFSATVIGRCVALTFSAPLALQVHETVP